MTGPAQTYASLTGKVHALIEDGANATLIARATLLWIAATHGAAKAAEAAYAIADELAVAGPP